jgi:uncharacterized protein (TIGR02594 family)
MKWLILACALFISLPQQAHAASWLDEAISAVGLSPKQLGVRRTLWCAAGTNKILRKAGIKGTGSDMASSFAGWGKPTTARPGAIAVMKRKGGGHVAIVVKDLGNKVLTVSPNSRGKVRYVKFAKSRIYTYRWPSQA